MIKKEFIQDKSISPYDKVSLKTMGNIYEVCYLKNKNLKVYTRLIDKDHYIDLRTFEDTGEVFSCNHIENRSQNLFQVGQSLKRLRDYINTNVVDTNLCKWITLTYKENMQDTKQLYKDFKNFIKRFRTYYKNYNIEYIVAMEPQGRGAWHCHCIFIFDKTPPFIKNNEVLEKLWSNGFTKILNLKSIDNVGAYLTAYLGDMEFTKDNLSLLKENGVNMSKMVLKDINEIEGKKLKTPKSFIKGGRLYLYPPNFNLYRISKGIKKPLKEVMFYRKAKEKIGDLLPTYSTSFNITDTDLDYSNHIIYEYYNKLRK